MKQLTNDIKIEFFTKLIPLLEKDIEMIEWDDKNIIVDGIKFKIKTRFGFCCHCNRIASAFGLMDKYSFNGMHMFFPEIIKYKPSNAHSWWWLDNRNRIEVCKKLIEEYKS